MSDQLLPTSTSRSVTAFWLAILTLLLLAIWLTVLVYVPLQFKKFNEYGLQLPSMTKTAVDITFLLNDFWYALLPLSFIVVLGVVILGRHGPISSHIGTIIAFLAAVILSFVLCFLFYSVLIANAKLAEGLSKT